MIICVGNETITISLPKANLYKLKDVMKEYKAALDVPYEDIPYEIMTTDEGGWGRVSLYFLLFCSD